MDVVGREQHPASSSNTLVSTDVSKRPHVQQQRCSCEVVVVQPRLLVLCAGLSPVAQRTCLWSRSLFSCRLSFISVSELMHSFINRQPAFTDWLPSVVDI